MYVQTVSAAVTLTQLLMLNNAHQMLVPSRDLTAAADVLLLVVVIDV